MVATPVEGTVEKQRVVAPVLLGMHVARRRRNPMTARLGS